ncbi:hypothetical protein Esti_003518 [Eimeria stiedai]
MRAAAYSSALYLPAAAAAATGRREAVRLLHQNPNCLFPPQLEAFRGLLTPWQQQLPHSLTERPLQQQRFLAAAAATPAAAAAATCCSSNSKSSSKCGFLQRGINSRLAETPGERPPLKDSLSRRSRAAAPQRQQQGPVKHEGPPGSQQQQH